MELNSQHSQADQDAMTVGPAAAVRRELDVLSAAAAALHLARSAAMVAMVVMAAMVATAATAET